MQTMIEMNWPIFAAVLALGLLVAWLVWRSKRAGERRQRHHGADVLDEGAAPARRNQALIDAPSAAAQASLAAGLADTGPAVTMSGIGEVIAVAAAREAIAAMPAEQAPAQAEDAPAEAAPAAQADQDDLTRIKGLGPKLKARLAELGVTRFDQIAAWSEADIAGIDAQLGSFAGRATRDQWVAQAGFLASGDVAGYEAKFGKL